MAVGDLVRMGISHPCTTLDRWPVLLLTNPDWSVVGAVRTESLTLAHIVTFGARGQPDRAAGSS